MQKGCNPNITDNAQKLLDYLSDIAGHGIITGQHTQTIPMEEVQYIRNITGHSPKLLGFEMLSYSPNINWNDASEACLTEVRENEGTLETAMECAMRGDTILTFTFHWFSPIGGRDKSFYAEHTDFDASRILVEGTPERKAFYHDMDVVAGLLKPFCDKDIPIIWRPFHESDGTWFWWGAKGCEVARELYKLMYVYFTDKYHLDNLIWVWNCKIKEGYPGDGYVDIIAADVYLPEYKPTDYAAEYRELIDNTTHNKVAALSEVGYLPDAELLSKSCIPWAYYMTWSKEFCIGEQYNSEESIRSMYDSEYSIKN